MLLCFDLYSEKCLVDSTIEYGYYTDNQIFGWANNICWLIKFGWLYQLFWLIQLNTMVNWKKRFAQGNNNFVVAVIIIIFIMNIVIKNSIFYLFIRVSTCMATCL